MKTTSILRIVFKVILLFRLSTILEAQNSKEDRLAKFKWVVHLTALTAHYNAQSACGTSFIRKDVNASNWLKFLDEKQGLQSGVTGRDSTMTLNSRSIGFEDLGAHLKKEMFRFAPGDKVILSRRAKDPKKKFEKVRVRRLNS